MYKGWWMQRLHSSAESKVRNLRLEVQAPMINDVMQLRWGGVEM